MTAWDGHIWARSVPASFALSKPENRRVPPPAPLQPTNAAIAVPVEPLEAQPLVNTKLEEPLVNTKLEVSLYNHHDVHENTVLQLERSAAEEATKTLKRLQLNIAKKLRSKGSEKTKKQKSAQPSTASETAVWIANPITHALERPVDVTQTSCGDLWQRARTECLVVTVAVASTAVASTSKTLRLVVDYNPPWLVHLSSFDQMEAHLFVGVPVLIEYQCWVAQDDCDVVWYVGDQPRASTAPTTTTTTTRDNYHNHRTAVYVPTADDVGQSLTVVLRPHRRHPHHDGYQEAYQFVRPIQALPTNQLLVARRTYDRRTDDVLRVLSWNVLADQNVATSLYPHCPADALVKSHRLPRVLHEILAYRADLVCLQEVDQHVYQQLFEPVLRHYGYRGLYSGKQTAGQSEGCALFAALDRFEWIDGETWPLSAQLPWPQDDANDNNNNQINHHHDHHDESAAVVLQLLQEHPDLAAILRDRLGHVVQVAHLVDRTTARPLAVANTHLFFHPNASHIRALQMWAIGRVLQFRSSRTATILCGDFNSSRHNAAGRLATQGQTPRNFRNLRHNLHTFSWNDRVRDPSPQDADFPALTWNGPALSSAIEPEPAFTHKLPGFCATLDHILVSDAHWTCRRHADLPTTNDSDDFIGYLPHPHYPSDHLSLVCDLQWKEK